MKKDIADSNFPEENDDQALTEQGAAPVLNVSVKTLQAWRVRGGGPPFLKLNRCVRYWKSDLREWMEQGRRTSTSDNGEH